MLLCWTNWGLKIPFRPSQLNDRPTENLLFAFKSTFESCPMYLLQSYQ